LFLGLAASANQVVKGLDYTLVLSQVPHQRTDRSSRTGVFAFDPTPRERGRICALSPSGVLVVLTPEFISAAQPSVSFDAKRILFAGKRSQRDRWDIWEMDIDGQNKRRLTSDFGNCLEPGYLATSSITPPDFADKVRWILFSSDQADAYDQEGTNAARAIYAMNIEPIASRGTVIRRSTFNLSSDFLPTVLNDGRVIFTSRQPSGRGHPSDTFPLLVTNWDGTGLNLFYESREGGAFKGMACEMPDRTLVFVESKGETREGDGQLARVSFKRPLHSREALSKGPGTYLNPRPTPDGRLLVSYSAGQDSRAICVFDIAAGLPGQTIHQDKKWDDLLAIVVVARPEPQGLLSAVVDAEVTADLHCIDVYESDLPDAQNFKKGDVKTARLVEGVPVRRSGMPLQPLPGHSSPSNVRLRILGEVPVEPDGSFMVRIPADTPFYVQLLDAQGMALETQRGWVWVRRGTSRQCLGCHEDKELAPENRTTEALEKKSRHVLLQAPETRRVPADFKRAVLPIVQSKCRSCHLGSRAAGGLDLSEDPAGSFDRAFTALRSGAGREHVKPGSARNSLLIEMFVLNGPGTGVKDKHPAVALTAQEKKALVEWIDLGARWEN